MRSRSGPTEETPLRPTFALWDGRYREWSRSRASWMAPLHVDSVCIC
jgi:hypothetical protein